MKPYIRFVLLIWALLVTFSQAAPLAAQAEVYYPTTNWRTSSPEAQGVDSEKLVRFLNTMASIPQAFHSIILIRHGHVVLDASIYPFVSSRQQAMRDSSDPIINTLIGIAIDKGYITDVKQSIWDFLPKDQTANMDANKAALTIEDFLTHRSGLNFVGYEDFMAYYPLNGNDPAWLQVFLDKQMAAEPGTRTGVQGFYGDGLVLSAILQKTTGVTAFDFAKQHLFGSLGISDVTWLTDPQGITIGLDEIYLSPQDMAKIAYLYLNNGQWDGKQIVSVGWVQTAMSRIVNGPLRSPWYFDALGYGWNISSKFQYRLFTQISMGGERIGVFPELDLIYIVTGDTQFFMDRAVPDYLLPAISDAAVLPENPKALAELNTKVQALTNPVAHDTTSLPDAFRAINGKIYILEENKVGWQTLTADFGASGSKEGTLTLGINGKTVKLVVGLDLVYRTTQVGLPAQPNSGAYRLLGDIPWMARISGTNQELAVQMGDLMGRESWLVTLRFPTPNQVKIRAQMMGLKLLTPDTWFFSGTAS